MRRSHFNKILLTLITVVIIYLFTNILLSDFLAKENVEKLKMNSNHLQLDFHHTKKFKFTTNVTSTPRSRNSHSIDSFFMSLSYHEQLTCATHNFLSAGYIAQNLGAKVVIPFLLHSRLYGIPDLIPPKEIPGIYFDLNTIFDMEELNKTYNKISGTHLVNFKEFIYHAPREIVMFDFPGAYDDPYTLGLINKDARRAYYLMNMTNLKAIELMDLLDHNQLIIRGLELMLRRITRHFGVQEFVIKEFVCIYQSAIITTDEIKQFIAEEPRSIILTNWRGCAYRSCNIKAPRNLASPFRHKVLFRSNRPYWYTKNLHLPFNNTIRSAAVNYLHRIKISRPYISLHIRIEKLQRLDQGVNKYTFCCLGLLHSLIKVLKDQYSQVLMITDVSQYGSDSCYTIQCMKYIRRFRTILANMGLVQTSYNPKLTGNSESSAFVSLVEMNMLAMGDRLIVVGGGSFESQIISEFLEFHPFSKSKVYHICTHKNNVLNEYKHLNRKC